MFRLAGRGLSAKALAGPAGYTLACIAAALTIFVAGVGYYAQKTVDSIGTSNIDTTGPSTGPMNILIMGLESRTYWDGTLIDHHLQYVLHTGGIGGEQTNTLILLHIFAGGQKAVAFSIPRDDYVKLYGTLGYGGTPPDNKIDDAYNAAMQQEMLNDQKAHPHWSSQQVNFDGNEAGREAAILTVEALTGVHIDKFAELNLVGFYELAAAFGGAEVCVKAWPGGDSISKDGNLSDPVYYDPRTGWQGSGFKGKVGYQLLTPEQTLAFVRDRHNVPGGDIGRTFRQQAVLDYVLWKLKTAGALADVSKLNSLMNTAKGYLAVPKGWNLLQFAGEMNALTSQHVKFYTLPTAGSEDITAGNIGDVYLVDVPKIQQQVQQAFAAPPGSGTKPDKPAAAGTSGKGGKKTPATTPATAASSAVPPASSVTVDVYNAGAPAHMATSVRAALGAKGYTEGVAQTATTPDQPLTTVTYGAGAGPNASVIASYFGVTATASGSVPAGHVVVTLGGATLAVPAALAGSQPTTSPSATPSSTSPGTLASTPSGENGGVISVAPNAKYGIPCVY